MHFADILILHRLRKQHLLQFSALSRQIKRQCLFTVSVSGDKYLQCVTIFSPAANAGKLSDHALPIRSVLQHFPRMDTLIPRGGGAAANFENLSGKKKTSEN